jgi:hypothetical protein
LTKDPNSNSIPVPVPCGEDRFATSGKIWKVQNKAAGEADHDFPHVAINNPRLPGVNLGEGQHTKQIPSKFLHDDPSIDYLIRQQPARSSETSAASI